MLGEVYVYSQVFCEIQQTRIREKSYASLESFVVADSCPIYRCPAFCSFLFPFVAHAIEVC